MPRRSIRSIVREIEHNLKLDDLPEYMSYRATRFIEEIVGLILSEDWPQVPLSHVSFGLSEICFVDCIISCFNLSPEIKEHLTDLLEKHSANAQVSLWIKYEECFITVRSPNLKLATEDEYEEMCDFPDNPVIED